MKVIYLDTKDSGISGDILLSALLELTDDPKKILKELEELKDYLSGISILQIKLEKIKRHELKINKLNIIIKENKDHRTVNELKESLARFLKDKEFSLETSKYAKNVLNSLINAEAKVHENLPEKVHLHELSSVDTLIDIIGVTKALNEIGYFSQKCNLYMSELPLGGGKVKTAHGILPVPAPATMKIVENSKLDVKLGPIENEITTPTGAALLTNLNITLKSPKMKIYKVAYSTGEKEFKDFLNILKIYYGEQTNLNNPVPDIDLEQYHQNIAVLETNVDDVTGENIGNFINIMESEDILDIQVIQGVTKKNRTSYIIKILCEPKKVSQNIIKIMEELGTLGVRFSILDRFCVEREIKDSYISIHNSRYDFKFKISYIEVQGEKYIINLKPEYEDLKNISKETDISLKKLEDIVKRKILEDIGESNFLKNVRIKKKKE